MEQMPMGQNPDNKPNKTKSLFTRGLMALGIMAGGLAHEASADPVPPGPRTKAPEVTSQVDRSEKRTQTEYEQEVKQARQDAIDDLHQFKQTGHEEPSPFTNEGSKEAGQAEKDMIQAEKNRRANHHEKLTPEQEARAKQAEADISRAKQLASEAAEKMSDKTPERTKPHIDNQK